MTIQIDITVAIYAAFLLVGLLWVGWQDYQARIRLAYRLGWEDGKGVPHRRPLRANESTIE